MNDTCNNSANAYLVQANSSSQANVSESKPTDRRCFIATAAFGSSESPSVIILRLFRDKYLLPYSLGQKFVRLYYTVSPSIADFIELHPPAPFLIRIALFPAVGIAFLCIKTTLMEKITLIIIALSLWLAHLLRHHQQNHQQN
jgi:hypothetical protein